MKKLVYSFSLILLMSCSDKEEKPQKELSADNPFNVVLNQPFDFANVTGAAIEEYVDVTIYNSVLAIEQIKKGNTPTLANTFEAYDGVSNELSKAYSNAFLMYWTSTDSITRAKGLSSSQKIDSLMTVLGADKALFAQFKKFKDSDAYTQLENRKKRFVDGVIENFEQSGVNLDEAKLERYKALRSEITDLTSQYSTNMNTADLVLKLDEKGAKGLPEGFKATYKTEAGYEIPVMSSTRGPVMDNAVEESTRKEFDKLYANRGADKNLDVLEQLVKKRYELGQLMGYNSFAEYNLVNKMAKNPENVWEFVNGLVAESKEKAINDIEVLKAQRAKAFGIDESLPINSWDLSFIKTKY